MLLNEKEVVARVSKKKTKVQQTIKTASSDEELAFKQKERDIAMYTRSCSLLHSIN